MDVEKNARWTAHSSLSVCPHQITCCPLAAAEAILLSHNDTIITEQGLKEDSHCPLSLHSGENQQAGAIIQLLLHI